MFGIMSYLKNSSVFLSMRSLILNNLDVVNASSNSLLTFNGNEKGNKFQSKIGKLGQLERGQEFSTLFQTLQSAPLISRKRRLDFFRCIYTMD